MGALVLAGRPPLIGEKRCESCKHSAPPMDPQAKANGLLDCRRYPPQVVIPGPGQVLSTFPVVGPDASCGEWLVKLNS